MPKLKDYFSEYILTVLDGYIEEHGLTGEGPLDTKHVTWVIQNVKGHELLSYYKGIEGAVLGEDENLVLAKYLAARLLLAKRIKEKESNNE